MTPDSSEPPIADLPAPRLILTRLGGSLGIAASWIAMAIFLAACAGYDGAFSLSVLPVVFGIAGLFISIIGGIAERQSMAEDTHVLAAIFTCVLGLLAGSAEMAVWLGWRTLSR